MVKKIPVFLVDSTEIYRNRYENIKEEKRWS